MAQRPGDAIENLDRLIEAVHSAREGGVVLCHLEPHVVGRVLAALVWTRDRASWSPGERYRHLQRLAKGADE